MKKYYLLAGSLALIISLFFVSAVSADTSYIVRYGDNLFRIARRFGTTPEAIQAANPGRITNINLIYAGDVLVIPTAAPPPNPNPNPGTGGIPYTVRYGDTLYGIATRYGTTIEAIQARNSTLITNPHWIYAGWLIYIPDSGGTGAQVPPAQEPLPAGNVYIVRPGDGLTGIARRYGTTVDALLVLNPQITNRHLIFVGEQIRLR